MDDDIWRLDEPLLTAIRAGDVEAARSLLARGANPNNMAQPLMHALAYDHVSMARLLIDAGASLEHNPQDNGLNAIQYCLFNESTQTLSYLLQNHPHLSPHTPSRHAMVEVLQPMYSQPMLTILLDAGIDPFKPVQADVMPAIRPHLPKDAPPTPYHLAKALGHTAAHELMERYAPISLPEPSQLTHADIASPDRPILQHPQGWQQFSTIARALHEKGTPITKMDLTREFGEECSYMRRAVECFHLRDALDYLHQRGEALTPDDLLDDAGRPNALLTACIERQALPVLMTRENWQQQTPRDLHRLLDALPEAAREQVHNVHALTHAMRQPAVVRGR